MIKKIIVALMITAASLGFTTTEAEQYNTENYCCGNYYDNDCCDYDNGHNYGRRGGYGWGRGCCR